MFQVRAGAACVISVGKTVLASVHCVQCWPGSRAVVAWRFGRKRRSLGVPPRCLGQCSKGRLQAQFGKAVQLCGRLARAGRFPEEDGGWILGRCRSIERAGPWACGGGPPKPEAGAARESQAYAAPWSVRRGLGREGCDDSGGASCLSEQRGPRPEGPGRGLGRGQHGGHSATARARWGPGPRREGR